jgi:hypothetical protein
MFLHCIPDPDRLLVRSSLSMNAVTSREFFGGFLFYFGVRANKLVGASLPVRRPDVSFSCLHIVSNRSHAVFALLSPLARTASASLLAPDFPSNSTRAGRVIGNERSASAPCLLWFCFNSRTAGHPPPFSAKTAASSGHRSCESYASSPPSKAPAAPNKTAGNATTTALRTPTPTVTPTPRTTLLTTARMENAIRINAAMIVTVRPRCAILRLAKSLISVSLTPV